MKSKLIAFLVGLLIMLFASHALGDEPRPLVPASATPAVVTPIQKGTPAPFSGVLYSPTAAAQVIADRNAVPAKIKLEVDAAVATANAQCEFKAGNAKAASDADARVCKAIIEAKDEQIKQTNAANAQLVKSGTHPGWWAAGGFVVGAIVTTAIVFGVNQATK
jgi:hypothetical protein